ncbi:MAG: outer membrane protein assembly factor BamD [Verrucomicrobiota bacterium]|nr:outer membrane protein assembly factor BamD [Verrucomicrobiota bacterium]
MIRWSSRLLFLVICLAFLPVRTPAPLVYRPGEGFTYESEGGSKWHRNRAKEQLEVAEEAFKANDFEMARKAAARTVRVWPLSDYAPRAQYLLARAYEEEGKDEKAFREYQRVVEKYPKIENYNEILERQHAIANRYLAGKWFKLWGVIPFFPSMDRTAEMYEKIIRNGPFSPTAPQSQMNIGAAREKQSDYPEAVKAYERAADKYHDQPQIAADALYKAGIAYFKQAKTAEYDQSVAGKAIGTFGDFLTLYPKDPRVPEVEKIIASLRAEQARGSFKIAEFYEKRNRLDGALVYYNEALIKDPNSPYADQARQRIQAIQARKQKTTAAAK